MYILSFSTYVYTPGHSVAQRHIFTTRSKLCGLRVGLEKTFLFVQKQNEEGVDL